MTDHLNNRLLRTINRMNDVPEGIKSIIDVELESPVLHVRSTRWKLF